MIYILAGNYFQFKDWCSRNDLQPRKDASYVAGPESVLGIDFTQDTLEYIDMWLENPAYTDELFDYLVAVREKTHREENTCNK